MYKAAERAFSTMFNPKPADEFGSAIFLCLHKPGVLLVQSIWYGENL
jgi:hypothetical protein